MNHKVLLTGLVVALLGLCGTSFADEVGEEAADGLPEGPGREAVQRTCLGACHERAILNQSYSPQEWQQCVDDMIALGAYVSEDEYGAIVLYLAEHFRRE